MGLLAKYHKPRTTVPGHPSDRYPWLVDVDKATAADPIWTIYITTIPLQTAFLYLVATVDLFSTNVLSWRLSNILDTEFCLEALEIALSSGRKLQLFHPDRACQFTLADFVDRLQAEPI